MASTGCTPAQAWNEWDIPSILAQNRYWAKCPPVHVLVAGYIGYKPAEPEVDGELTGDDLLAMFPPPV